MGKESSENCLYVHPLGEFILYNNLYITWRVLSLNYHHYKMTTYLKEKKSKVQCKGKDQGQVLDVVEVASKETLQRKKK